MNPTDPYVGWLRNGLFAWRPVVTAATSEACWALLLEMQTTATRAERVVLPRGVEPTTKGVKR